MAGLKGDRTTQHNLRHPRADPEQDRGHAGKLMEPCTWTPCLILAGKLELYKMLTREEAGEIAYWNDLVLLFFKNFLVKLKCYQDKKIKTNA